MESLQVLWHFRCYKKILSWYARICFDRHIQTAVDSSILIIRASFRPINLLRNIGLWSIDILLLELLNRHVCGVPSYNGIGSVPYLDQVVLRRTAHEPRIIQVPAEIRDSIRVTAMHEKSAK